MLVRKYQDSRGEDREVCAQIERAVDSSPSLRSKKDLIEAFVESLSVDAEVDREWRAFIERKRREELDRIIADENLDPDATRAYIDGALAPSSRQGQRSRTCCRRCRGSPQLALTLRRSRR